ncbi:MAG TPA: type II toxin-antitoxin system VapC family toxin [Acidimicrobiales bacterium]|jgi:predicted nucleic acid-binding protein|nr:type II toxin-antitoxin system VapC family toxin [Acidimicrobiales bacterium]
MTECLDSWAVLRWLEGNEPAAGRVEDSLTSRPVMSWINIGEVAYIVERLAGTDRAEQVVRQLRHRLTLDLPSESRVLEAARIKARHPMAYADAFAVATAMAHDATVLTGDPEILDADGPWRTEDLRA